MSRVMVGAERPGTTAPAPTPPAPAAPRAGSRLRPVELLALALAGLLPVVVSPQVSTWFWAPKAALALVAVGPGLVLLAGAIAGGDRVAWAAAALLAVAGLSTVVAPEPGLALLGLHNLGTGFLFVAAGVAMWSLGRALSEHGRRLLGTVLLVAVGLNVVVAWVEMSVPLGIEMLQPDQGRAAALLGNPVHVAALCVAGLALAGYRLGATRDGASRAAGLVMVAAIGGAIQLSGGRSGLVLAIVLLAWVARRFGARLAVAMLLAVVVGAGLAGLAARDGSVSAAARASADPAAGLGGRVDRWALALPAIEARPLLGFGPGQFRRATSAHTTLAAARAFGPDTLSEDAHDLVVEYATTTGLLGLAALAIWLALAGRRARGPLATFALMGGLSLLVQPQSVGLTPVLLLALGAAAPPPPSRQLPAARSVAIGGAIVGAVAAVLLLRSEVLLRRATGELTVVDARAAERALPSPWSIGPATEARAFTYDALRTGSRDAGGAIVAAAREAVRRDPSDPLRWNELAGYEARWGSIAAARDAYAAAGRANPWSRRALQGRAALASRSGRAGTVEEVCRQVHRLAPNARCPEVPGATGSAVAATRPSP